MLTLFSVPKPFVGHIGTIQRNAIRSWTMLQPRCDILLFGNDAGTAEAARDLGVQHLPDVAMTDYGTPRLDHVFRRARAHANTPTLCYVNADIVLFDDLLEAVRRVPWRRFLLLGQRWDIDVDRPLDFDRPGWDLELREEVRARGVLHPPTGCDYYVFSRDLFDDMPPFAIGRGSYDNWFIWYGRARRAAVIDATRVVMSVHQNHDRTYSSMGLTAPLGEEDALLKGSEARRNFELAGGRWHVYTVRNANWLMHRRRILPALAPRNLWARLKRLDFRAWGFHT